MPQLEVFCTVSNCYFWKNDNMCGADKILITGDSASAQLKSGVDAGQMNQVLSSVGETPAESCMETSCKTFKHR